MKRATTVAAMKEVLAQRPLTSPEELETLFVETADARDPRVSRRHALADRLDTDDNIKIIAYGHRGTGKSTELNRFAQEHAERYTVMSFSVLQESLLGQVTIEPLLVLTAEAVLSRARVLGLALSEKLLQAVYGWFSEAVEYREDENEHALRVGAGVDTTSSLWGKLLGLQAALKADVTAGCRVLNKTITKENRRLAELVRHCNLLINEARTNLREQRGTELLLVIEDLDKCSLTEADAVFIENPAPLTSLSCKAVYTAPLSLRCSPRATDLANHFQAVVFPMIKVTERDGSACDAGRSVIREILERRLDAEALLAPEALDLALEKTGGVLRHLFDVLVDASISAREQARRQRRDATRIEADDVRWGLDQLKSTLLSRIGTAGLPAAYRQVTTEQLVERIRALSGKAERSVSDDVTLLLMSAHALIEYNGEGWCRLHPLVEEHYGATLTTP